MTIQFGHNDQKIAPPESMGTNLTLMVQQVRALGAEPVLVTSLTRRTFNADGTIDDTLGPWADGLRYRSYIFGLPLATEIGIRNYSCLPATTNAPFGFAQSIYYLCHCLAFLQRLVDLLNQIG